MLHVKLDIDDCESKPCDSNATCSNTAGSFTCACKDGFTGNGTTCTGKYYLNLY